MIEYDTQGRMKYNPELHHNQGTEWNEEDTQYLIDWYDIVGIEEIALALGRSEGTVNSKINVLRKKGLMQKPATKQHTKKIIKDEKDKPILAF